MNNTIRKQAILFLFLITAGIIFLAFNVDNKTESKIEIIELNGDSYLSKDLYFKFAGLDRKDSYNNLNLAIIKDRIEKHPYVEKAFIKNEKSKVVVEIEEKNIDAVVYSNDLAFLITSRSKLLPLLQFTENINLPVIKNPQIDKSGELDINNRDLITALKIIKAIQFVDASMFEDLSEIDLRNGNDIVVYFSSLNYPVVLGRKNEIKKILYFNSFWSKVRDNSANKLIRYADLRYNKQLIIGLTNSDSSNGNKKI